MHRAILILTIIFCRSFFIVIDLQKVKLADALQLVAAWNFVVLNFLLEYKFIIILVISVELQQS